MMRLRVLTAVWVVLSVGCVVSKSHAELIDRGGGLVYDTEADVTWLRDASYARTTGVAPTGLMSWEAAMSWASDLEYYDEVRETMWSDWRLPDSRGADGSWPCFGYECPGSEHGRLYEVYGIRSFAQGPFVNHDRGSYWSSTRRAPLPGSAWLYNFTIGKQDHTGPFEELVIAYAHAVRDGDVGPAPDAVSTRSPVASLLLAALLGAIGRRHVIVSRHVRGFSWLPLEHGLLEPGARSRCQSNRRARVALAGAGSLAAAPISALFHLLIAIGSGWATPTNTERRVDRSCPSVRDGSGSGSLDEISNGPHVPAGLYCDDLGAAGYREEEISPQTP